jgi:hypothetical protein
MKLTGFWSIRKRMNLSLTESVLGRAIESFYIVKYFDLKFRRSP